MEKKQINYDDPYLFEKREVKVLTTGDTFGELALIDLRNRTTATIVTRQDCEFTCIDRKHYWEILGKIKRVKKRISK